MKKHACIGYNFEYDMKYRMKIYFNDLLSILIKLVNS